MRCRQHPLDITVYLRLKKPVFSSLHLRFHGLLLHRHVSGSLVSCQKKDKKKTNCALEMLVHGHIMPTFWHSFHRELVMILKKISEKFC